MWEVVNRFKEQHRTALLTTHYMDEAERLCDRLAIVDHGRIIAEGSPRELIHSLGGDHVVEISVAENGRPRPVAADLEGIASVRSVHGEAGHLVLTVSEPHVAIPGLLERLRQGGWDLASLTTRHASLEDVFVALTGRQLRDE
jgi:ABC-2 type transport system ATP-binding protein